MSFLDKKNSTKDGIYRPSLKDVTDKSKGYTATIRFLPNLLEDGTLGPSAIEKTSHYAKLPDYQELQGYYDSLTNFGEKCPLTTLFWNLYNSDNQAEVERSKLINKSTKYYSYVLVIEDEQHPELEGKILIYPFGFKIKEKIDNERNGENADGKKCNVFDPANGKDFRLIIKQQGDWPGYDSSTFKTVSPLKIWDEDNNRFIEIPTEWNEDKEKNVITSGKVQKKVIEFLNSKEVNLSDHEAKQWTEEEKDKVKKIIGILSGKDVSIANDAISNASTSTTSSEPLEDSGLSDDDDNIDDFFGDD
jgi:hypothetical protein